MSSRVTIDFGLMTPAARVVEDLLVVVPGERVVIVHDVANAEISLAFEHAAVERGATVERIDLEGMVPRPWSSCPASVLAALSSASATLVTVSNEEGEYDVRHALVMAAVAARARHIHMVGVSRRAFVGSMMANCARVFDLIHALRAAVRPTAKILVRTAAGTNVEIDMAPHLRWFANGNAVRPGQWMNVPYGSLVTSPASVSGTYVADAAVGGGLGAKHGVLSRRPIRLTLEAGRVKGIECPDSTLRDYAARFVAEAQGHDRVGLVSIGTNLGILSPLGEIIHDENMPGVHLALGEPFPTRTGATWTSHGQLAFALSDSDVDLDGQPLIRHGRYVRFV